MHVTLRQLQVFETVSRLGSVTRAAEELHLSQPAVSMQVRQLEGAVGMPLLEQVGRRLRRTDAGEVMTRHARAIAEQLREAEGAIEDLRGGGAGRLRISVATTVNYFATRLLAGYCREHPRVEVSLDVTNRETVIRQLAENTTDIVLMGQPPARLDLIAEPFMENPLVVIDASTLEREDFIHYLPMAERDYPVVSLPVYNDRQRFYYVPRMRPDEVLIVKQLDTRPDRAVVCPHTSFVDPTSAPDAPDRTSIDIRFVCVFPKA